MGRVTPQPLDEAVLRRELVVPGSRWARVRVVAETGSTNTDLVELARAGEPEGLVLFAENQRAGRGRLDRSWQAPPGSALTLSVLLRPAGAVPVSRLGWLPLLTGVAVARACTAVVADQAADVQRVIEVGLKWPNDLLVRPSGDADPTRDWGKCGGILVEVAEPGALVVGIGLNVTQSRAQLPEPLDPAAPVPTSLRLAGAVVDRTVLAVALLRELADGYGRWLDSHGDPVEAGLWQAYRAVCRTLGREVRVSLPGGEQVAGLASEIDPDGRLVVTTAAGTPRALAAGDVRHVR